jgi:hypothetical protein
LLESKSNSIVMGAEIDAQTPREQPAHVARACSIIALEEKHFFGFVDHEVDGECPWFNFEVGVAVGRSLLPRILVCGAIGLSKIAPPIGSIHLVGTGDNNRLRRHLVEAGLLGEADSKYRDHPNKLDAFFRQIPAHQLGLLGLQNREKPPF